MNFELPQKKENKSIIRVIGVGGGGGNAVDFMFRQGIEGVEFLLINTDQQAFIDKAVKDKMLIGFELTGGNGVGSKPETARLAAENNIEQIKEYLNDNVKMVFLTAGLGKGTGTGATPVIAKIAKEMGILTVGMVTTPFKTEGYPKKLRALDGLKTLYPHLDSIMVIDNDNLTEIYGDLSDDAAYDKANEVLYNAIRGIANIITVPGKINADFEDVKTALTNSGIALMGSATASGPNRAEEIVKKVLDNPLLKENDIMGAAHILLNISYANDENSLSRDEMYFIENYIQEETGYTAELTKGSIPDASLGDNINLTVVVTGFSDRGESILQNLEKSLAAKPTSSRMAPPTYVAPIPVVKESIISLPNSEPQSINNIDSEIKKGEIENAKQIIHPPVQETIKVSLEPVQNSRLNSTWGTNASQTNPKVENNKVNILNPTQINREEPVQKPLNGYVIPEKIELIVTQTETTNDFVKPDTETSTPILPIVSETIISNIEENNDVRMEQNVIPVFNHISLVPKIEENQRIENAQQMVPSSEYPYFQKLDEVEKKHENIIPENQGQGLFTPPIVPAQQSVRIPKETIQNESPVGQNEHIQNVFKPKEEVKNEVLADEEPKMSYEEFERIYKAKMDAQNYHQVKDEELKSNSEKIQNVHELNKFESTPAYIRREMKLEKVDPADQISVGSLTVTTGEDGTIIQKKENPYLNKSVD